MTWWQTVPAFALTAAIMFLLGYLVAGGVPAAALPVRKVRPRVVGIEGRSPRSRWTLLTPFALISAT